jgi:hypothetical protein
MHVRPMHVWSILESKPVMHLSSVSRLSIVRLDWVAMPPNRDNEPCLRGVGSSR